MNTEPLPLFFYYLPNPFASANSAMGITLLLIGCAWIGFLYARQLYRDRGNWRFPKLAFLPVFICYIGSLWGSGGAAPPTLTGVSVYFAYGLAMILFSFGASIAAMFAWIFIYQGSTGTSSFAKEVSSATLKERKARMQMVQ